MSETTVIELHEVDIVHEDAPSQVLIRSVNWQIHAGQCWAIGGDPASGKSSLLATAAGLNRPGSGTLKMFGRALADASEAEQVAWRRRLGFVFENGGRLLTHLTVAENVALPLEYHADMDEATLFARVDELLTRTELRPYADALPSRLSPRLQQRVALARAIAVPTDVLLLDDPLGGLGLRDARWWLNLLRAMQSEQKSKGGALTILATCGDFRGWMGLATDFAILQGEQFRTLGGRDELLASHEPAVREFLATAI